MRPPVRKRGPGMRAIAGTVPGPPTGLHDGSSRRREQWWASGPAHRRMPIPAMPTWTCPCPHPCSCPWVHAVMRVRTLMSSPLGGWRSLDPSAVPAVAGTAAEAAVAVSAGAGMIVSAGVRSRKRRSRRCAACPCPSRGSCLRRPVFGCVPPLRCDRLLVRTVGRACLRRWVPQP